MVENNCHFQAQFVEVELDAFAAISLVSSNSNSNGDLSGLVDDCRDLPLQRPQVKVSHCFKETNCCADALARMGSSYVDVSLCFVSPPPHVIPFYVSLFTKKKTIVIEQMRKPKGIKSCQYL